MSAEVDWVLETIKTNWSAGAWSDLPLKRIDRDNSELLEGDIRSRKEELQESNYVGATYADRDPSPIGTEYDHEVEAVIGVRVEGLTNQNGNWGYVDPDGAWPPAPPADGSNWGVPFDRLVHEIKRTLLRERSYPTVPGALDTEYYTTLIANEAPDSASYADYYRWDFDLVLQGDEQLP